MTLEDQIQQEIGNTVPQMIEEAVTSHTHNGSDSATIQGHNLSMAPQSAITTATGGTAGATYTSTEQGLLNNAITRIADLEKKLQILGLIN